MFVKKSRTSDKQNNKTMYSIIYKMYIGTHDIQHSTQSYIITSISQSVEIKIILLSLLLLHDEKSWARNTL